MALQGVPRVGGADGQRVELDVGLGARERAVDALVLDADADGSVVDCKTFLVPRTDYEIVDVWNVVGLRGTASNDIVVDDVFVPEGFTLSMSDTGRCFGPGQEQNPSDLYKLPFHSLFTSTITSPIVGMATGAYDEHVEMQQQRVRAAYLGEKASSDPFAAVRIARAGT